MKLFFISPFCLLRPTTNRIFDVRFCDMMSGEGAQVTMIYPYYFMKENIAEPDIKKNYGVSNSVTFKMLKTPLSVTSSRIWQLAVLLFSIFFISLKIIFSKQNQAGSKFIVGRDNKSLLPAMFLKKIVGKRKQIKIVTTVHEVKAGRLNKWMYRNYDGILVTTSSAGKKLVNDFLVSEIKVERLLSPVSKNNYSAGKPEARKIINYTDSKPLVVYTGKLGKGIAELDYILEAAKHLPEFNFILTGGKPESVNYFTEICRKKNIHNVCFTGFINDSTAICNYQLAADALISYYTTEDHTVEYNFPQKLIEYMHARTPIVTPDFPATHDVINSSNAIIVQANNSDSLADGIKKAIEEKEYSQKLADKAFRDVQIYSNDQVAKRLVKFFQTI
jgi:glycosyltransferase involved in cell wall biosynthesis